MSSTETSTKYDVNAIRKRIRFSRCIFYNLFVRKFIFVEMGTSSFLLLAITLIWLNVIFKVYMAWHRKERIWVRLYGISFFNNIYFAVHTTRMMAAISIWFWTTLVISGILLSGIPQSDVETDVTLTPSRNIMYSLSLSWSQTMPLKSMDPMLWRTCWSKKNVQKVIDECNVSVTLQPLLKKKL